MKPRNRLIVGCACLGVALIVVPGFLLARSLSRTLAAGMDRFKAFGPVAARLPQEMAAARREGLPLTPQDLRRTPAAPAERNAAPIYAAMVQLLNKGDRSETDNIGDVLNTALSGDPARLDRNAARALLTRYDAVVRLADRAAAMPDCDFGREYAKPSNVQFPEFAATRAAARLLALRACVESADGNTAGAFRSIGECARIGRHAASEPVLIGLLVRIAIDGIAERAFQNVLLAHLDSPQVTAEARAALRDFGETPDLSRSIGGEMVMGLASIDEIRAARLPLDAPAIVAQLRQREAATRNTMCNAWKVRCISYWRSIRSALRSHPTDMLASYRALKAVVDTEAAHENEPTYELIAVLAPVAHQAESKVMEDEARRRICSVLIDLADYHRRHGVFPNGLADLGASLPLDPYTDKPLLYRREGRGFVLYSVGRNFKDDGGREQGARKEDRNLDIVVRYPLTPQ